jgi:predicted DNA binding CopG/RHH family protein
MEKMVNIKIVWGLEVDGTDWWSYQMDCGIHSVQLGGCVTSHLDNSLIFQFNWGNWREFNELNMEIQLNGYAKDRNLLGQLMQKLFHMIVRNLSSVCVKNVIKWLSNINVRVANEQWNAISEFGSYIQKHHCSYKNEQITFVYSNLYSDNQ